jgi:hypothetical protein
MTPLLIGLALLAPDTVPIEDITAQFVAETQANHVACVAAEANIGTAICYGLDAQFAPVIQVYAADGTFTPYVSAAAPTTTAPGAAAPTTAAPAAGAASFGPGIQLVGTDIQPGTYRATVEDSSIPLCTWQRLSGLSGETDDIITIDLATEAGAQVVVEIQPGDVAFDSSGCGTWTPV